MMHNWKAVLVFLPFLAAGLQAQDHGGWRKVDPAPSTPEQQLTDSPAQDIIKKFAAKEAEFAIARDNYTYRQTARVQEIDPDGVPGGKWEMVEDVMFSLDGKRTEHVVNAPVNRLRIISLTPEDEKDLRSTQPFVLTTSELPKYDIVYLGKQNADEIPCYVFSVKPKTMEKGLRYFQGQIWVDDRDLQIVKSLGRGVGTGVKDQAFPKFETYRQQVDGMYWFPVYTRADSTLHFPHSPDQRIRMLVKYEDYKQFKSKSTIQYGDAVDGTTPDQNPQKQPDLKKQDGPKK
jgi:hypothetical protein